MSGRRNQITEDSATRKVSHVNSTRFTLPQVGFHTEAGTSSATQADGNDIPVLGRSALC